MGGLRRSVQAALGAVLGAALLGLAVPAPAQDDVAPGTPGVVRPPLQRTPEVAVPGATAPTQPRQCPRLVGRSLEEARKLIIGYELGLGPVTYRPSDVKPGTIIDQATVARPGQGNGTCAVVVAEAWTVVVPQLVGRTFDGAQSELSRADYRKLLSLGRVVRRESDRPANTILAQRPEAGTRVSTPTSILVAVAVPPPAVTVPNVTRMTQPEAEATIARPGYRGWLALSVAGRRDSPLPAGTIIGQDPAPGTRIAGPTRLRVWLAQAPAVVVPDLSGLTPGAAVQDLTGGAYRGLLRLRVLGERAAPNGHPAGTLFAQEPPPGTRVTELTIINAWVAAAPPPVRVPDLSTLAPDAARTRLGAAEFRGLLALGTIRKRESKARPGTIVDQRPPPGTPVTAPAKVEVWVAEAPRVVLVPNLVDLRPEDAKVHLAAEAYSGLLVLGDVRDRQSDKPAGVIVDHSPAAGTKVTGRTEIDVWVATAALVVVPDLAGMTREGALAVLGRAGLTLGDARTERSDRQRGSIIGQAPTAGRRVPVGTAVSIVLVAPPAFWKPSYLIAAALAVLLVLAAWTAWRRLRPRLARVAYRSQRGPAEVTLEAAEPEGRAVRLRAHRGPREVMVTGGAAR